MADLLFIAIAAVFFGLCVLYVRGCERLIASADDDSAHAATDTPARDRAAA
jgi:hypothetical protein